MKVTDLKFIIAFGVLLLSWSVFHWDAILGMESIWRRSDTFAHGYFILPISIWLIWRNRKPLLTSEVSTSWLAFVVLLGSSMLGLLAGIADVSVVAQLSAVSSLVALIWLVIGNSLAWHYKFPLAYLIFLVPMGENLIPWLQDVTAWFTVFFLQMTGIPVFRDGLYIQTPTGLFEVAVACSGIRYLIASAAVGVLFAYLSYSKFKKQIIFSIFAITLPILANGIRAYLIVIIAHYSDMKYATGADHLVYGWLFFGFVIMIMFWIGGKFADNEDELLKSSISVSSIRFNTVVVMFSALLLLLFTFVLNNIIEETPPLQPNKALNGRPVQANNWGISFQSPLASSLVEHKGAYYFKAVYAHKQSEGELVEWRNKLHNSDKWTVIHEQQTEDGYRLVQLRDIHGKQAFYGYFYSVGDNKSTSTIEVKIRQTMASILGHKSRSTIRAVMVFNIIDKEKAKLELSAAFSRFNEFESIKLADTVVKGG